MSPWEVKKKGGRQPGSRIRLTKRCCQQRLEVADFRARGGNQNISNIVRVGRYNCFKGSNRLDHRSLRRQDRRRSGNGGKTANRWKFGPVRSKEGKEKGESRGPLGFPRRLLRPKERSKLRDLKIKGGGESRKSIRDFGGEGEES